MIFYSINQYFVTHVHWYTHYTKTNKALQSRVTQSVEVGMNHLYCQRTQTLVPATRNWCHPNTWFSPISSTSVQVSVPTYRIHSKSTHSFYWTWDDSPNRAHCPPASASASRGDDGVSWGGRDCNFSGSNSLHKLQQSHCSKIRVVR